MTPATQVRSIWLDAENASDEIEKRLRAGDINGAEAEDLRKFVDDGYVIVKADLTESDADSFDQNVDRLWKERPPNVSFAYDGPPRRFSEAVETEHRRPRYRIHDMHSWFEAAMRLYLDRKLQRYASLILGETAVATQSLFFEYGSQQALHRDSIVVPTPVFGHLLASWIAIEDIDAASGPLEYVPGSHKLPMYEFRPGQYLYDAGSMGESDVRAAMKFHDEESARRGLATKRFLARRGEVLLWHSALLHGGAAVGNDAPTRKSFVVHYSTMRNHPTRSTSLSDHGRIEVWTTGEIISRDGANGFANPLDGALEYTRG